MDPFAQAHLSELLSAARQGPPVPGVAPAEYKRTTFIAFNAALNALKGVGAISDEETVEWSDRMLVALGGQPRARARARAHGPRGRAGTADQFR